MIQRPAASAVNIATLEACIDGAGRALACPYSSSAEFDAALIRARRAAGVYGPRRHRRTIATAAGMLAGLAALVLVLAFL